MAGASVHKETVIIVEPSCDARARVSQAVTVEKIIGKIVPATSLQRTLQMLRENVSCDIVFISQKFSAQEVLRFIAAAKNTRSGEDAAYILLLSDEGEKATSVAKHLLNGADGFLMSPFNVDAVQSVIRLALRVKRQRMIERVQAASALLLSSLADDLDHLYHDVTYRGRTLEIPPQVEEKARLFRAFNDDEREVYYAVLAAIFSKSKPPVRVFAPAELLLQSPSEIPGRLRPLVDELASGDWRTRFKALEEILAAGAEAERILSVLVKVLDDESAPCRHLAKKVLSRLDCAEARVVLERHQYGGPLKAQAGV